MEVIIFISLVIILVCTFIFSTRSKHSNISGPRGIPFIGNAFQLDPKAPHHTVTKWIKYFGDVYKIKIMGTDIIVVSGEEAIRHVLVTQSNHFSDRVQSFRTQYMITTNSHIAFSNNTPEWAKFKKLTMVGLKMIGDGVKRLEVITTDLLENMVKVMVETEGKPFNPKHSIHETINAINATLIFGRRFTANEERCLYDLDIKLNCIKAPSGPGQELDLFPWLRFLPNKTFKKMKILREDMKKIYKGFVESTKRLVDDGTECESALIDVIRYQQIETKNTGRESPDIDVLIDVAHGLIVPANITTYISIQALVAILASDLDLQKRCQDEVDKAIGHRSPTLSDRTKIPFIESLYMELLRYLSHTPLSIPHKTTCDTDIKGKYVPKGTAIWVNLWHLHHNPELWDDPWTFKPRRFLDEQGNLLKADHPLRKRHLPFGAGRRVCAGEAMAKNRLFLIVTTLLQRLTFLPEYEGAPLPTDPRHWNWGTTIYPDDFKIRALPR